MVSESHAPLMVLQRCIARSFLFVGECVFKRSHEITTTTATTGVSLIRKINMRFIGEWVGLASAPGQIAPEANRKKVFDRGIVLE